MTAIDFDALTDFIDERNDQAARIAELKALIVEANQRIRDLETQLAAVPKWTRITDDPATWPPDDKGLAEILDMDSMGIFKPPFLGPNKGVRAATFKLHLFAPRYWRPWNPPQVEP